jgi:hypothetical protein
MSDSFSFDLCSLCVFIAFLNLFSVVVAFLLVVLTFLAAFLLDLVFGFN